MNTARLEMQINNTSFQRSMSMSSKHFFTFLSKGAFRQIPIQNIVQQKQEKVV